MLITLCYSVLTWMQSRQRVEIIRWLDECLVKEQKGSIVFIRDRTLYTSSNVNMTPSHSVSRLLQEDSGNLSKSESFYSNSNFGESPCHSGNISRSSSTTNSAFSTPRKDTSSVVLNGGTEEGALNLNTLNREVLPGLSKSQSFTGSVRQISELCYNHSAIKLRRLLWEEDRTRAIVLMPTQIVELHDWTAFRGTEIEPSFIALKEREASKIKSDEGNPEVEGQSKAIVSVGKVKRYYILLEAEPGLVQRSHYRKFTQFGEIVAWKCGSELALILHSQLSQLIELMHIFRLGQIILEGGWRIYRLTTINCEGTIGTLISGVESLAEKKALTPADLRRLSAGIYETRDVGPSGSNSLTNTPKNCLSKDTSKHDITTICEETLEELETVKRLPNWYERSPRKRSVATLPSFEKSSQLSAAALARRRVSSFCPGSLTSSSNKSTSLASLVFCAKSMSVEEEDYMEEHLEVETISKPLSTARPEVPTSLDTSTTNKNSSSKSFESLLNRSRTPSGTSTPTRGLTSPMSHMAKPVDPGQGQALSASSSPRKVKRSPCKRIGKPPNILVLCDSEEKREEIGTVLKAMLANDRYAVYDIRWDQLAVGGWSEATALLVLSGKIPNPTHTSHLLQFLGDGGRLLAWCCEHPPFGPVDKKSGSGGKDPSGNEPKKPKVIEHGQSHKITRPLILNDNLWGVAPSHGQPPPEFQKILETNDSEGYSRPMTVSAYAKVKGTNETVIVQLDGGALGGKALLSQIEFENCLEEEDSLALLSLLLSQNLGIDCTQIKSPEYTIGYLLGDHIKVMDFLKSTPSTIQQSELTVEFTQRGEKGSLPSHLRFPIHSFACPQNFSTVDYYDNLETKELGRLVIYTDTVTSTMNVVSGHSLGHGLTVIANRQTSGKGRGRNVWLSPEGCALFTIQLYIDMGSHIGRRIPLVQLIAALAVVMAVPNRKEINLRVKWPNDIYANDQKIGGILVNSTLEGKKAVVNIGIGVNVSNSYPTVCLNSLLHPKEFSEANATAPPTKVGGPVQKVKKNKALLTTEKFIAKVLTELENLLGAVEKEPLEKVLKLYTDNWIHGDVEVEEGDESSIVNVEVSHGAFTECRISGVDEYGFLRVTELGTGNVFSVQPDGNSFDIANRLIKIKD